MAGMMSDLEMYLWKAEWYSPIYIERELLRIGKKVDQELIETDTKYQKLREIRLGRILCLCLYQFYGYPHFATVSPVEPPDVCLMGKDFKAKTSPTIYKVEATTYIGTPKKGIVEHLKDADKISDTNHKFGKNDVLLINVGIGLKPDLPALNTYLESVRAPYTVWALQDITDEVERTSRALFTSVYPEYRQIKVPIAEIAMYIQNYEEIERITLNKTGSSKVGIMTKKENVPHTVPWEITSK